MKHLLAAVRIASERVSCLPLLSSGPLAMRVGVQTAVEGSFRRGALFRMHDREHESREERSKNEKRRRKGINFKLAAVAVDQSRSSGECF